MNNSQLLDTLRTLTKTEWNSFQKYLHSPFFNQRADVIALATIIQKEFSKQEDKQFFEKAMVWKKLEPNLPYDDKQLRYTMSYLLDLVEHFFANLELQSKSPLQKILIHNALQRRGLEKGAASHLMAAQQLSLVYEHFDPQLNRVLQSNLRQISAQQSDYSEKKVLQDLDVFTAEILTDTIREGCNFLETRIRFPNTLDFPWLEVALSFCEQAHDYEKSATLSMLYHTYRMLEKMPSGGGEVHFYTLKKTLTDNLHDIPVALQRETWLRSINFAIRQQNLGNKNYGKEAFELYKSGIKTKIILEYGQISKKSYSNTLVLALLVGEWDWAEQFLKDYKDYLPENERDNTYRLNLATLFFKQKAFNKVLETLQNVGFTDTSINLDGRRLLLCCYFELQEWDALNSLLDSFGIWLRRSKNLGYLRELYGNHIKFTRRLLDVQHQHPEAKEKLKQDILATRNVASKDWLLEKL